MINTICENKIFNVITNYSIKIRFTVCNFSCMLEKLPKDPTKSDLKCQKEIYAIQATNITIYSSKLNLTSIPNRYSFI